MGIFSTVSSKLLLEEEFEEKRMITNEQIKARIAEAIRLSGMTQSAIAKEIGVCQQAVSNYRSGSKMPALDTFANLCKVIDADPAYILGLTD